MCNHHAPNNFDSPLGDANGDGNGDLCLSRTRHPPDEKRRLKVIRIALYRYRGLKSRKCKTQIATRTGARLSFHHF
jgi:hypothetical protein